MATGLDAQRQIFAGNPGDRRAFEALEEHFFLDGDWESLVEVYRARIAAPEIATDDAQQAPLLFRLGQILEERILDIEAATEVYWTLARLDPTNRPALRQLRGIHEREAKWDLVLQIAELESATSMPPYDRAAFETQLGRVWQRHLEDSEEARHAYDRALEADPDFPAALEGLAALHQEAERYSEAAEVLTRLTERLRGPERAPVWTALGTIYANRLDEPTRARECFDRALDDDPYQPSAVEWSLLLATMEEDWIAVSDLLERRFDLASGARHRAAIAVEASQIQLNHLQSTAGARAWIDRAIELSAEETSVLLALAEVERADGDRDALLVVLDHLIKLTGDRAPRSALIEAAELHAEFGNPELALETIRRAGQKTGQDDSRVLLLQARLLRESGSKSQLAEILETLTALGGGIEEKRRVEILIELARLQEEDLGDEDGAQGTWETAFELDPGQTEAIDALERIHRKSDNWDALRSLFESALEAIGADEPSRAGLSARFGDLLLNRFEDPERARQQFESALELQADCRPAHQGLRKVAERTNNTDLLLEVCEREAAEATGGGQMAELARTAIPILQDAERIDEALVWAMRWSKAESQSREAFQLRANFQEQQGAVEDEIKTRKALAKLLQGSECARSLGRQSDLHLEQGDPGAAAVALELALEQVPGAVEPLRTLCSVYRELDRTQDLARILRGLSEAVASEDQAETLEELAEILHDPIGDLDAAIVVRWRLADLPNAPDDADEKLEALLEMGGRYGEIAQLLDTRRARLGDESDAAFELDLQRGRIRLDSLGQSEEAAEIFTGLHERHPDNEEILDQLEKAFRAGHNARGLCDLIERRAGWETDPARRSAMQLERAGLLEDVLGESILAADLYEQILLDDDQDATASTTETAGLRLESLLESSGQWERLRERLTNRVDDLPKEEQATLRERIAAICLDRLHDVSGCASQLESIADIVTDRVHVWQKLAELYANELDRPADWLRVTEAELEAHPENDRELSLRVAAARLILDDDRRPADRRTPEAYVHYERALEIHPSHAEAAEVLAHHFLSEGRHEDTVRILESRLSGLSETDGSEANDIRLRLAGLYSISLDNDLLAQSHLEAARLELGNASRVCEPLAELYERTRDFEKLSNLAREVMSSDTPNADQLVWRVRFGKSEHRCGRTDEAASAYRGALLESPDDREIEDALIDLYQEIGEVEPLTELLEKRLPYAPEEEAIDLRMRLAHMNSGSLNKPREALRHLEWILESHPQHRDAFDQALAIADEIGEPENILVLLDRELGIPLPPIERSVLLERRAKLFADSLDRPEQAVVNLREALALDPANQTAQRTLRDQLEKLNRWPAVLDCLFVEAASAAPAQRIELLEEAAEVAWSRVNPDASLPWLARLREERPEDPELLARLAEVHRRAGRFEAALRAYDGELELHSDASRKYDLHLQRARLLERELHAPGRAISAYLRAAEVAEDKSESLIELDRLYDTMGRPFERAGILESRVAVASDPEATALRQTLASLYCRHLSKPELALPHLEANVAAAHGELREELQHLSSLGAALRASHRHDSWVRVAERELELIESNDDIREGTPSEYRTFLREELAQTYDRRLGAPEKAIEHLKILEAESADTHPRITNPLRDLFRRSGRFVELAENLSADLEADSGTAADWLELAQLREEKIVDLPAAIRAYESAESGDAQSLMAIRGRRRCCERLRDWDGVARALEAEVHQDESLDRRQRTALARKLGDVCWQRLGAGERAAAGYRLALEIDENDIEAIRALTTVTEACMGGDEVAALYLREIELLGEENVEQQRCCEIWLKLASIYRVSEETSREAIAAYLEASKIARLSASDELCLARLHGSTGDDDEFTETFGSWCDREDSGSQVGDHLELARVYQRTGETRLALLRSERATAVAPESGDAWSLLAEFKQADGDLEGAADAFERAAEHASPDTATECLIAAADCIHDLDLTRAHVLLTRAGEFDAGGIDVHVARARVASQLGRLDETQEQAEIALDLAPNDSLDSEVKLEIAVLGGRAAAERSDRDASRRLFQIALDIDGDQLEALDGVAEAHFKDGDFGSVRPLLERRLEMAVDDDRHGLHLSMIARSLEADDLLDAAWSRYEEAIELDATLDDAHDGLVRVHERTGRLSEAVDALERWSRVSTNSEKQALASYRAAEHRLACEDAERAMSCLEQATTSDPTLAPAWLLLCQLVGDRGVDRETERVCQQALDAIEPGEVSSQISLRAARLAEIDGHHDKAIELYADATRWDSRCSEAALSQSRLIRMAGDWVEADAVLASFIEDHPDPESPTLAQVHLERGRLLSGPLEDFEAAILAYRRALELQPDLRVATTALGRLLLHSQDRWREALGLHREILESSPTTAASLRALVQIAQQRGQTEVEEGALALLRALGLTSPQEAASAPSGLRLPIHPGPPMSHPDGERLRRIAHQLREELAGVLSNSGHAYPICQDAEVSEAIRQISELEDELSAPNLARLQTDERCGLFTEIAALFLDPGGNGGDSHFRDGLDRSLGRWTRRKVRRIVEETNLAEIGAFDHQAWGEELRAMAAAQAIDRNGGDLRTTLRALLVIESQDPSQCPPEGAEIGTRASASEPTRQLLIRITSMLCERLEHAG